MTADEELAQNDGAVAERLPTTPGERVVAGRPTRRAVLEFFSRRFGIPHSTFADHTFWEKGAGRVWAFGGELPSGQTVETLGLPLLRVRQAHWKPTTDGAQRFGEAATRNVLTVDRETAAAFFRGEDQAQAWDGDWGYLFVATDLGVLGVGLFVHGELRSMIPKGRRRDLR
ncbi:MAG: hypothetical protein ABEJ57_01525 [Halobacteriaceae archaeon]